MAPSAVDSPQAVSFITAEEASKAPPGVVLPPKEIRGMSQYHHPVNKTYILILRLTAIVEKTAGYVARNGEVFECTFSIHDSS